MLTLSALVLLMRDAVSPIATDALVHTAAHDKKRDIRIMAIMALGGLGLADDPRAVDVLTAALQREVTLGFARRQWPASVIAGTPQRSNW